MVSFVFVHISIMLSGINKKPVRIVEDGINRKWNYTYTFTKIGCFGAIDKSYFGW